MTVQDTSSQVTFVGTGSQLSFAFIFRVDDLAWLDLDYLVDFSQIVLNGDQDDDPGGSVEYLVAPALGQQLTITRTVPHTQDLDYTRYNAFDSESHENALDKLTMMLQDNNLVTANKSKSITIESPSAAENITLFYTPVGLTILSISTVLRGSSTPTLDWTLEFDSNRNPASATEAVTGGSTASSTTVGDDITIFNEPAIPADSFVWLKTTGISGSIDSFHATIRYREELP